MDRFVLWDKYTDTEPIARAPQTPSRFPVGKICNLSEAVSCPLLTETFFKKTFLKRKKQLQESFWDYCCFLTTPEPDTDSSRGAQVGASTGPHQPSWAPTPALQTASFWAGTNSCPMLRHLQKPQRDGQVPRNTTSRGVPRTGSGQWGETGAPTSGPRSSPGTALPHHTPLALQSPPSQRWSRHPPTPFQSPPAPTWNSSP